MAIKTPADERKLGPPFYDLTSKRGRPPMSKELIVRRLVAELPPTVRERTKLWDNVPDGTRLATVRKEGKKVYKAIRFWRQRGFIAFVGPDGNVLPPEKRVPEEVS